MKKLLLGLGTIATVAAPVVIVVSCGDNTEDNVAPLKMGGSAVIKNHKGIVTITAKPTDMLTEKQASIALAAIKTEYNDMSTKVDLTVFWVIVRKGTEMKKFILPTNYVSEINEFIKNPNDLAKAIAKAMLKKLHCAKTANDVGIKGTIKILTKTTTHEGAPMFRASGRAKDITVDNVRDHLVLEGYAITKKQPLDDVMPGKTTSYIFKFQSLSTSEVNTFYITVSVIADIAINPFYGLTTATFFDEDHKKKSTSEEEKTETVIDNFNEVIPLLNDLEVVKKIEVSTSGESEGRVYFKDSLKLVTLIGSKIHDRKIVPTWEEAGPIGETKLAEAFAKGVRFYADKLKDGKIVFGQVNTNAKIRYLFTVKLD